MAVSGGSGTRERAGPTGRPSLFSAHGSAPPPSIRPESPLIKIWGVFWAGAVFPRRNEKPLKMKADILPSIALLATILACVLLPVSASAASIALSVTGMLSVLAADYGRNVEPVRVKPRLIPFNEPGCPSAGLREAA